MNWEGGQDKTRQNVCSGRVRTVLQIWGGEERRCEGDAKRLLSSGRNWFLLFQATISALELHKLETCEERRQDGGEVAATNSPRVKTKEFHSQSSRRGGIDRARDLALPYVSFWRRSWRFFYAVLIQITATCPLRDANRDGHPFEN